MSETDGRTEETIFTWGATPLKFGPGAVDEIGFDIAQYGVERVLVITDANVHGAGLPQRIADSLTRYGVRSEIFDGVHVEPTDESMDKAAGYAKAQGPWDGFVAVGGGSAIDTAKAVNLLTTDGGELMDYINKPIGQARAPKGQLKPLIAVPTTAGTGSESTAMCVLDVLSMKVKTGISHWRLRPTLAVIDPLLPDYSETYTPWLPLGFSISRHIYWLEMEEPNVFASAEWILCFPQYWVWRFTGRPLAECSYLGAHNQLWAPLKKDFSSLVQRMGWRDLFPEIAPAGSVVGETTVALPDGGSRVLKVHNGVHDSNAALAYYRMTGLTGFTIVSTGTWVIIINLDCPLSALDGERDMISNVTVNGEPAPSLRFMGGREFDLISGGWNQPIGQATVERVMARGVFALPSWAAGGPFPETEGRILGGAVEGEERAAVAALYVAMMTDLSLDLIQSDNLLVVDGGLAKIDLFTAMLAQLRPSQTVVRSSLSEGSATGAAALAFRSLGLSPFKDETTPVSASRIEGLEAYRDRWRAMAEDDRAAVRARIKGAAE